jgi:UDP-N-acetylglucosamine:LPS N-acetylglucosamine transferase
VPNGYLTGGHQLKNAAVYAENGAVEVINEHELDAKPQLLVDMLRTLLAQPDRLEVMSASIHTYAKPQAAKDMADMIVAAAK